jgi:hypothetical protein
MRRELGILRLVVVTGSSSGPRIAIISVRTASDPTSD